MGIECGAADDPSVLCALHSVIDRSTAAAKAVRDVAVEEMLHMALVPEPHERERRTRPESRSFD
jgi:ferritin-like protein